MKTLWILEDHASLRRTLQRVFAQEPDLVCESVFGNAEAMLESLAQGKGPDALLIDLGLPDLSGLEVIARVRSGSPHTVVIVLTVYEEDEKIFRAVCAGAAGYLLKGSGADQIVGAVRDALAGGSPMSPKIARRVLEMFSRLAPKPAEYGLSERENQILQLIVAGLTNKELAAKLELSVHTVDSYLRRIYTKLEVHNRSGAVAKALRERLT
jgi:DNA-binding NarL/FixJ family response regulator